MKKILSILFAAIVLASCDTSKEILYFQDAVINQPEQIQGFHDITLQPKDQVMITVSSKDPKLAALFNINPGLNQTSSNNEKYRSYTLDENGDIDFPILGTLHLSGKTRSQVAKTIKTRLVSENLVKDPVVIVNYMNLSVSVLGEVKNPGKYSIEKDRITLLDAISEAGDLTITGQRANVLVIREENGQRTTYQVDMRSKDVFNSPVYYLKQNDVVYVQPNKVRAGQSTINVNNLKNISFWTGMVSFFLSIGTIIFK